MDNENIAVIETNINIEEIEDKENKIEIPRSTIDMLEQTFQMA